MGRDRPNKDVDDWANVVWGKPVSPGVRSEKKRKVVEEVWEERLMMVDGKVKKRRGCAQGLDLGEEVLVPRPLGLRTNTQWPSARSPVIVREMGKECAEDARACQGKEDIPIRTATPPLAEPAAPRSLQKLGRIPNVIRVATPFGNNSVVEPLTPRPTPKDPDGLNIMARFLSDSLVWIARPCGSRRPSWRVASSKIVPAGQRVHSLETLMIGCGWFEDEHPGGGLSLG